MLVACKACGSGCKAVEFCCCPANRPSPIFVFFTLLMNVLVIIFGIKGLTAEYKTDDNKTWLIVIVVLAIVNILFSFYIYCRFHTMTSRLPDQNGASNPQAMSPWSAAWKLMMFDIGVCIYIIVWVFIIVWLFMMGNYKVDCGSYCDDAPSQVAMTNAAICMWIYVALGGFVIAFSLCTQCCSPPKHQQVVVVSQQPAHGQYAPPGPGGYPQQQPGGYQQQPGGYPQPQQQPVYPQQQPAYPPPQQQYPQATAPAYPPAGGYPDPAGQYPPQAGGYPEPAGQYPPYQQRDNSAAEKVGNAVGAALGKGISALKK